MKISVVVTVLNEEKTISSLLKSLLKQSKKPDEIVIVDGGSKDKTVELIREFQKKSKLVRLFIKPGTIAHGRNYAIKKAKYSIISQIDAGCIAQKHWLEEITKPFVDPQVQVVAGFYEMTGERLFQRASIAYHGIIPVWYDPRSFLPSSRSVAFKKSIWKKVGGYSEMLDKTGEDTLFNYQLIKKGIKITQAKEAIVYWELPNNLWKSFKKFFWYAYGDVQTGIWWHPTMRLRTHNIKISMVFLRYFLGLVLLLMSLYSSLSLCILIIFFITYLFWSIWKMREIVTEFELQLFIPIIQLTSDIGVMLGFVGGVIRMTTYGLPQRNN